MRIFSTITLLLLIVPLVLAPAAAQDLDLNIPGLEEETQPAPAPASTSGTVSSEKTTLLTMIKQGGWAMWPLGAFSLGVIGLLVFSLIDLQKKNFHPDHLVAALQADLENADLESASAKLQVGSNCLSNIMSAAFNYLGEKGYGALESEHMHELMATASKRFNRGRAGLINYFNVISQAAPMMGLLGTVSGMIGAFAKLSQGGTGDPSVFAGNISEALITTASGLLVALPAIFCYFSMRGRLQGLASTCDEKAEELIGVLRRAVASYE